MLIDVPNHVEYWTNMPNIGDPAPDFSGNDFINNTPFTLSDHAGKVIVLSFVNAGCSYCNIEAPCLVDLWNNLAGHGVQVVAVHVGWWGYTENDGKNWLTGLGATFPAVHEDSPYPIYNSYIETGGLPHTYVIGRDMVIRKDILGAVDCDVLEGNVMDVVYMRDPVDVELVMDVSNSMNSPSPSDPTGDTKLVMMKKAATIITDFLHDNGQVDDRLGLIWFTDDVDEYQNAAGQKLLPIPANWWELRNQIDIHGTGMCTAMGAGLQTAFDTLSASTQKRFAILCTDGMQNIEPKVAQVGTHLEIIDSGGWLCGGHSSVPPHPGVDITSYNTTVHTIGIGITATYEPLLQEIADQTGGFYKGTNDPENDLDLIYLTDLCNCMAGASPAIVHHNVGVLHEGECESIETFYLNDSVRKITVILSWEKAQGGSLSFWLRSPDGVLLDLHSEMKLFETHCLATVYLPRVEGGTQISHVGQWTITIRGETGDGAADYHIFVVGEDLETKMHVDVPRKIYEVGEFIPVHVKIVDSRTKFLTPTEIVIEKAVPRIPLADLLSRYKVSAFELRRKAKAYQKDPLYMKIESLSVDPRYQELLRPERKLCSLRKKEIECEISPERFIVPIALEKPGLHSFKVEVLCESEENGPIHRVDMVTVNVGPGKVDPKQTKVVTMEYAREGRTGLYFAVTPKNGFGQMLGPGLEQEIAALVGRKEEEVGVQDNLDGTYSVTLLDPVKKRKRPTPVTLRFSRQPIWKRRR